jgi:hypothetical protein
MTRPKLGRMTFPRCPRCGCASGPCVMVPVDAPDPARVCEICTPGSLRAKRDPEPIDGLP